MNRAVSLAANWLISAQRLNHYFGVTYDMYEIYKQDDAGNWVNIDTGGVKDAETQRTRTGTGKAKEKAGSMATPLRARGKVSKISKPDSKTDDLLITENLPWKGKQQRGKPAQSALRQRIAAEIKLAMQQAQQKRASGDT